MSTMPTTPSNTNKTAPAAVSANSSASATVNDPNEVMGEFDGGQYLAMLARALGSVAAAVVDN